MTYKTPPKPIFDHSYPTGDHGYYSTMMRNNFQGIHAGDLLPFRPLAHDNPDMSIMVLGTDLENYQRGTYYGNNSERIPMTSGDLAAIANPSEFDRIDVVYVEPDGTLGVELGTEALSPSIPAPPSGDVFPVCAIYHPYGTTKIVNYGDRDSYSGDSYIMADLRPLHKLPVSNPFSEEEAIIFRNTKNIMLNRLKTMAHHNIAFEEFVDGWSDDFQDSTGIVASTEISGDLVSGGDGLRYSRGYTHRGTPDFDVISNKGSEPDGKGIIIGGKVAMDFLATRASVIVVSESGDGLGFEISRNSGDTWNDVPLTTDFYDGRFYYASGQNNALSGAYSPANTGDYYVTIIHPSGDDVTDVEAYAVSLA